MQDVNKTNQSDEKNDKSNLEITEALREPPQEETAPVVPTKELRSEARDRAKQRPVLQKILKFIRREDHTYRELIINSEPLEKRVALLVDGVLDKFEVERSGEDRMVGAIYKGKIQNLEPGLKAAFVDIGEDKNAFLHYWDILPAASDATIEIVRDNKSKTQRADADKISIKDIPRLYPIGTDIVIQISKSQIGSKGPRTTTNIALPGRYIVLMPHSGECGISRKIEDKKERDRLKKVIRSLTLPEGMGIIIRTAGEGKKIRYFIRDLHLLLKKWDEIMQKMQSTNKPLNLYQEPDIIERTVRDFLTEEIDRVLIDNKQDYERIVELVEQISPRSRSKIFFFDENIPIFQRFNIERQIEQTFHRRVPLQSGGEIVIEETEALTAIDVNTGGHKGATNDGKDFILNCNLEAAIEASRQIRLRNIGGLIILDFIDMKNKRDRNMVYAKMRDLIADDRAKTHILPISQLGILQMTRQRHKESTARGIYAPCPYCTGRGIVKASRTMSIEIQRKLVSDIRRWRAKTKLPLHLRVFLHPQVLERLRTEDEAHLIEIEDVYNVSLSFRADPSFHMENFKVLNAESGEEIR